ncbi:methyltransferase type 11 [Aureimonas flava]|uniref:Methyltransferase type 11 n=1 Tax=Aureimonas flava TaxID=2320271 RepID=A0A3A1WRX3_9HYPH|nr:small ribosomal subunit Rsm22 family protein [Aureimonas flava]RIY00908.1 methyltransferase type 11 [Aureimonas flava]
MDLPLPLRAAIEAELAGTPSSDLQRAGETLSTRYRAETRDGRLHLSDDLFAKAYAAARLPATYAALRACLDAVSEAFPAFAPSSLLDVGAGPGTALWAGADAYSSLAGATLLEASDPIRRLGERLGEGAFGFRPEWQAGDLSGGLEGLAAADLVTLSYVLDEIEPGAIAPLAEALWARTRGVLLVVEPGTPAGWRRILAVRDRLVAAGARVVAPCPHAAACPVQAPDWCHFARRLPRSRLHLRAKEAEVPFEDEKFAYVALTRGEPGGEAFARVLAPPRAGSGKVRVRLCRSDGTAVERLVTKRDGEAFRRARRADWGDRLPC